MNAIIAVNPQQMQEAQSTTISWVERKLAGARQELERTQDIGSTLATYGLRTEDADKLWRKAKVRVRFYEKVKAALDAGYYIIPPFNIKVDTKTEKNFDGSDRKVAIFRNGGWPEGLVMPKRALNPELIEETANALGLKIFDALGIAPAYRAADPIIAGQIKRPGGGVLTFFVAWWLDESDL